MTGRAGLQLEEYRAGLQLEEYRAGLQLEEYRAGLQLEEYRAGLQTCAAPMTNTSTNTSRATNKSRTLELHGLQRRIERKEKKRKEKKIKEKKRKEKAPSNCCTACSAALSVRSGFPDPESTRIICCACTCIPPKKKCYLLQVTGNVWKQVVAARAVESQEKKRKGHGNKHGHVRRNVLYTCGGGGALVF
jgi:hypothetical protein